MKAALILQLTLLSLFSLISINAAATTQLSYGSCQPKGSTERGDCIHILDCPYLFELLNSSLATPAQRQQLSESQCGLDNTHSSLVQRILVCCPESKRSPRLALNEDAPEPGNVLPSIGKCGLSFGNRIFGGNKTELFEYPWMALLQYKTASSDDLSFNCGGSLINSRYVLTASHCLKSLQLDEEGLVLHSVRLGEWDVNTAPDCANERNKKHTCAPLHMDIVIEKKILHELYVPNSIDETHDIALLRLERAVTYTNHIKPICLPVSEDVRNKNFLDFAMEVAGWGVTEDDKPSNVKLKTSVDVWSLDRCQEKYKLFKRKLNNSQICAGGKTNGVRINDTCRGDSGGPLMAPINNGKQEIFYVAGVTSYGPQPCGSIGWPGVYTRVGHYIDWVIGKLEP